MAEDDFNRVLEDLEQGLRIDENKLEEALQSQPDGLYRVSKEFALAISRRDWYKQHLAEVKAEAETMIRRKAKTQEGRTTDKEVEALVLLDDEVQEASDKYLRFRERANRLEALKDAFVQRSYALKDLVELYLHNYYGDVQTGGQRSHHLQDRRAEEARKAMAERRSRAR